jgi:hypothetical protein
MGDAPAPHHALVMPFVAVLLQRTLDCHTVEAHQHAPQRTAGSCLMPDNEGSRRLVLTPA